MPQINVTISDEIADLLNSMSTATGISRSSLIAEYVRRGLYQDIESQSKVARFKEIINERKDAEKNQ